MEWKNAIEALPKKNLNAGEMKQKEQYEAALAAATAAREIPVKSRHAIHLQTAGQLPWEVAMDLLPELRAQGLAGITSSVRLCLQTNFFMFCKIYSLLNEGLGYLRRLSSLYIILELISRLR